MDRRDGPLQRLFLTIHGKIGKIRVPLHFFSQRVTGAIFLVKRDLSLDLFVIRDNVYVNVKAALELRVTRTKICFEH